MLDNSLLIHNIENGMFIEEVICCYLDWGICIGKL